MSLPLRDRHVVVTGGTGALGTAVLHRLRRDGAICHVPVLLPEELKSFPLADDPNVHVVQPVDLTDAAAVDPFFAALPPLWASVHCAGGFGMSDITATTAEAYRHLQAMNADTCFLCCRAAVANMRASELGHEGGRIVNIVARPALEPRAGAGMVAYTMSKAAVAALTVSLAEEVAAHGIWVNAVAPSILDTPANRNAMPDAETQLWPTVDDVAETIVFLASTANHTTRGGLVPVYGKS